MAYFPGQHSHLSSSVYAYPLQNKSNNNGNNGNGACATVGDTSKCIKQAASLKKDFPRLDCANMAIDCIYDASIDEMNRECSTDQDYTKTLKKVQSSCGNQIEGFYLLPTNNSPNCSKFTVCRLESYK